MKMGMQLRGRVESLGEPEHLPVVFRTAYNTTIYDQPPGSFRSETQVAAESEKPRVVALLSRSQLTPDKRCCE